MAINGDRDDAFPIILSKKWICFFGLDQRAISLTMRARMPASLLMGPHECVFQTYELERFAQDSAVLELERWTPLCKARANALVLQRLNPAILIVQSDQVSCRVQFSHGQNRRYI